MNKSLLTLALLLLVFISQTESKNNLSCINHDGKAVDWWVMLKMPKDFNVGQQFYYYDNHSTGSMTFHKNLNDMDSPLMQTLDQIQNTDTDEHITVYWNDQPFDESEHPPSSYAHSKGVIGANEQQGFLINHSTPHFIGVDPSTKKIIKHIEENQRKFGQHYFCITMDSHTLNEYGLGLIIDRVFVEKLSQVPSNLETTFPNLKQLLDNNYRTSKFPFKIIDIQSVGGQTFKKFAKSYRWKNDLYSQVVAPTYNSDFIFETWGRPLQAGDFSNKQFVVSNLYVTFTDEVQYKYTHDHSKYGIAKGNTPIVCFGDLNRMTSQFHRGGGTICFLNEDLHSFITKAFTQQQEPEK